LWLCWWGFFFSVAGNNGFEMENAVGESQPLFVSRARTDLARRVFGRASETTRRRRFGTRTGKLARECDLWDCYRERDERTNDDESTFRGPPGSDDYAPSLSLPLFARPGQRVSSAPRIFGQNTNPRASFRVNRPSGQYILLEG
jgi:hypothetical protein